MVDHVSGEEAWGAISSGASGQSSTSRMNQSRSQTTCSRLPAPVITALSGSSAISSKPPGQARVESHDGRTAPPSARSVGTFGVVWLADRRKAGLGPKMLRECLSVLSLVLGFAVKSKGLSQNPAKGHDVKLRRREVREGDGVLTMQ
jgi:hypothetical protein